MGDAREWHAYGEQHGPAAGLTTWAGPALKMGERVTAVSVSRLSQAVGERDLHANLAAASERLTEKAEARVRVLEAALGKYGAHSNGCASMDGWKKDDWPDGPPCTCGLAGALASAGTPEEASDV